MSQSRMTRQRAVILEALRGVTTHPTADEVYAMVRQTLPRISLGTVYRNLDLLANSGGIRLLEYTGQQKRFDGNLHPHQHIRCVACGKVGDVFSCPSISMPEATCTPGFSIHAVETHFIGLCEHCQALPEQADQLEPLGEKTYSGALYQPSQPGMTT